MTALSMPGHLLYATRMANYLYKTYSPTHDPTTYKSELLVGIVLSKLSIQGDIFPYRSDSFCGMLIIDEDETTIVVNSNHERSKRFFTIAHELGHFFLHRSLQSHFYDQYDNLISDEIKEMEQQANAFAAELMVPRDVLAFMLDRRYNFHRMALSIGASYASLRWRLIHFLQDNERYNYRTAITVVDDFIACSESRSARASILFRELNSHQRRVY